jgi:hypothetical protein
MSVANSPQFFAALQNFTKEQLLEDLIHMDEKNNRLRRELMEAEKVASEARQKAQRAKWSEEAALSKRDYWKRLATKRGKKNQELQAKLDQTKVI